MVLLLSVRFVSNCLVYYFKMYAFSSYLIISVAPGSDRCAFMRYKLVFSCG